jgi:hypothetical protein
VSAALSAERSHLCRGSVDFFLNFLPLDVAERDSNNLIDKDLRDLLPKGAGNFEGQKQVGVKSTLFNAIDGLARHTHLGGQLGL